MTTLQPYATFQELDALLERGEALYHVRQTIRMIREESHKLEVGQVILQRANNIIASAAATMYHHP